MKSGLLLMFVGLFFVGIYLVDFLANRLRKEHALMEIEVYANECSGH